MVLVIFEIKWVSYVVL